MAEFTVVIGNKNYSSWSMRGWLMARIAGIEFDEIVVPLDRPETQAAIRKHSPSGRVPVLLHRGLAVWDSRKDPQLNVERILKAIKESPATQKDIKNSLNDWRNIMDVWVHRIERPNGKHFEVVSRLNMAAMLFPQGIVGPPVDQAGALAWETPDTKQTAKDPEQASDTNPWVGRILITCGALIGVTWYARWRAKQGSPLPGFPALRS